MRKTRSDSLLSKLTPAQKGQLLGWMRENVSYDEIARRCGTEFGIQISHTAVCDYCRKLGIQVAVTQAAEESTVEAGGFEILISCKEPRRLTLAIRPLPISQA